MRKKIPMIIGITFVVFVLLQMLAVYGLNQPVGRYWYLQLPISAGLALICVYYFGRTDLDIHAAKVGDGQYGDAEWLSAAEQREAYGVRMNEEQQPGFVLGNAHDEWMIDSSDKNMLVLAPPGGGKSTSIFIPTILYNARVQQNTGKGASMLCVDIKGDLYAKTAPELQAVGYRTPTLNLRAVYQSYRYNVMYRVNEEIDAYQAAKDNKEKSRHYGAAERYAKIAAEAFMSAVEHGGENNAFFAETAKNLVIGIMLLVSLYAPKKARHIISVYSLIVELNQVSQSEGGGAPQRTELSELLDHINDSRVRNYIMPTTSSDIRTTLNIFSSALAKLVKFIDAEMEQLLCEQSPELDAQAFITQPTVIYLICPDENPTRHFLATLFINNFANSLIELAETNYSGVLPRKYLCIFDEFGNLPPLPNAAALFSAMRSRGGRVMIALQSYSQLAVTYGKEKAGIIEDCCQIVMTSFTAPSAESTAKRLSTVLGNETVLGGTVSTADGKTTQTKQMVGRALMSVSQIITMPLGMYIVMCGGQKPWKSKMRYYRDYLAPAERLLREAPENDYCTIINATKNNIILGAASGDRNFAVVKGMFDE